MEPDTNSGQASVPRSIAGLGCTTCFSPIVAFKCHQLQVHPVLWVEPVGMIQGLPEGLDMS